MALTERQLQREYRAKLFNAYFGNFTSLLVPLAVVALTLYVGHAQRESDARRRDNEQIIAQAREDASTRRDCLAQMRDTARLIETSSKQADSSATVASVASSYNDVCGPVGVALPAPLLQAVQQAASAPGASPETRTTAARVIATQPIRLFIQIGDEEKRAWARQKELQIEQATVAQAPIVVPGIERVAATPDRSELRYANAADAQLAQQLGGVLTTILGVPLTVKKINASNASPRTFELWLAN